MGPATPCPGRLSASTRRSTCPMQVAQLVTHRNHAEQTDGSRPGSRPGLPVGSTSSTATTTDKLHRRESAISIRRSFQRSDSQARGPRAMVKSAVIPRAGFRDRTLKDAQLTMQARVGRKWRTFKQLRTDIDGTFEGNTASPQTSGRVALPVFRAPRKRQSGYPYEPGARRSACWSFNGWIRRPRPDGPHDLQPVPGCEIAPSPTNQACSGSLDRHQCHGRDPRFVRAVAPPRVHAPSPPDSVANH